ncbi:retinol dehydrogenase 7-like [Homarus americanus]|uniref:retinol dehydrogenase 7-like n=1 Tax=Homarus americanus TaxID=6706 RepID=UPI001C48D7A9|nr:retinol dehydrogenase 7-like [Homarus americanus]XP_042231667.1 retinol dehydrogenase 7-like [Homarus americanus]
MWWMVGVGLVGLFLAAQAWRARTCHEVEISGHRRVVVITGCDSGIGYSVAMSARAWGWTVVATCLSPDGEGAAHLREAGVHIVIVDLTQTHTLAHLLHTIQRLKMNNQEVWCVVNNAGLLTYASCEWQTSEMVERQVAVNLTGVIQVTKALLPTLRRNKGRVVMVSSPAGQVGTPTMSVYSATKWGVEGFTQAIRRELASTGVSVVLVRPCNLPNRTGILRNNAAQLREMIEGAGEETLRDYGEAMKEAEQVFHEAYGNVNQVQGLRDDRLLECFRSAIMSKRPLATYSAAPLLVRVALNLLQLLPTAWVDFLCAIDFHYIVLSLAKNS